MEKDSLEARSRVLLAYHQALVAYREAAEAHARSPSPTSLQRLNDAEVVFGAAKRAYFDAVLRRSLDH